MSKVLPREGGRDDAQGELDPADKAEAAHGATEGPLAAVVEVGVGIARVHFVNGPAAPAADPGRLVVAELDLLADAEAAVVGGEGALDANGAERISHVRGLRQEQCLALFFALEGARQADFAVAKDLLSEIDGSEQGAHLRGRGESPVPLACLAEAYNVAKVDWGSCQWRQDGASRGD